MSDNREDFNALVDMAMASPGLSVMRPVVEEELLHYEIFQALEAEGLLKGLVFRGGTSLRLCRGSDRFSEDLDFAGGKDFLADSMQKITTRMEKRIGQRFGLKVAVNHKPSGVGVDGLKNIRVSKWWISIETSPENPAMPRQRIKLEVANIPAHTRELVPLRANYELLSAMPTVLINTETLEDIMADKVLAFPTSLLDNQGQLVGLDSSKIRHRDQDTRHRRLRRLPGAFSWRSFHPDADSAGGNTLSHSAPGPGSVFCCESLISLGQNDLRYGSTLKEIPACLSNESGPVTPTAITTT